MGVSRISRHDNGEIGVFEDLGEVGVSSARSGKQSPARSTERVVESSRGELGAGCEEYGGRRKGKETRRRGRSRDREETRGRGTTNMNTNNEKTSETL